MTDNPYAHNLDKRAANYQPLTPLSFLERAAAVYPEHVGRHPRGAALHLCRALRARPPARLGAGRARRRRRRHRLGDARQHAADAGGALRRADDRRRAAFDQHAPRCGHRRLPARPCQCQDRDLRPRVRPRHARGACASEGASRSSSTTTTGSSRKPGAPCPRTTTRPSSPAAIRPSAGACRATSGTRSRSTTPRARPAIPRASSTPPRRHPHVLRQPRRGQHGPASRLPVDAADVPLQRLVLPLDALGGGGHARVPALGARRRHVRGHRRAQGHAPVRGADRHVDAARRQAGGEARRCRTRSSSSRRRRRRPRPCSPPWRRRGSTSPTSTA